MSTDQSNANETTRPGAAPAGTNPDPTPATTAAAGTPTSSDSGAAGVRTTSTEAGTGTTLRSAVPASESDSHPTASDGTASAAGAPTMAVTSTTAQISPVPGGKLDTPPGKPAQSGGGGGEAGKADDTEAGKADDAEGKAAGGDDRTSKDSKDKDSKDKDSKDKDSKDKDSKDKDSKDKDSKDKDSKDKDSKDKAAGDDQPAKPADPFAAFAPAPEVVPGRIRRIGRGVGRRLVHEWTLAGLGALALAVLMTWPTLRYPRHTLPQDYWDPALQAWQVAWSGHILLTKPAQLWQSNAFFPETWTFAFSDTLLGYAPAGMIGQGPEAAILRYNILFVLAHALAVLGAYALVRQLGAGRIGAAVAGIGFAYAPWLLGQAGHLHVLSNGGIPLALAMLARGHGWSLRHGYRPERRRSGWAFAGWLVAAWQLSLGFGIGLVFAYVMGLIAVVVLLSWLVRRILRRPGQWFGFRLLLADFWGGAIFAATGALLAIPYFKVAELHPHARRTAEELRNYSPPPGGFLTAPPESLIWGDLHEPVRAGLPGLPETTLLPGYVLFALALAGLLFSVWTVRQRLLLLAAVLVTGVLAMGSRFFGGTWTYLPLFEHLPGWDGLRTPGRLMIWVTLLLGVLAAGSVGAFAERARQISAAERVPPRPGPFLRLVTLLPIVLVLAEGLNTTPHPVVPVQPASMRVANGPILVLPSDQKTDQHVMLWSTSRFQDTVNGGSGFTPNRLAEVRQATANFPDQASIDFLRNMGVRTVIVLRDRVAGTPLQATVDLPVDTLGISREDVGETVVYRL
ncbi:hypothetical protein R6Y94_32595 [Plantactinospora sp. KLBMP9567]|nr:hypothetical protein [Plantactinospora sp. KLBMP9567]MDW5328531.1 hypothetical protein [Plantactinospora sp. KLBMP9567]